jgi:hypothetical protein
MCSVPVDRTGWGTAYSRMKRVCTGLPPKKNNCSRWVSDCTEVMPYLFSQNFQLRLLQSADNDVQVPVRIPCGYSNIFTQTVFGRLTFGSIRMRDADADLAADRMRCREAAPSAGLFGQRAAPLEYPAWATGLTNMPGSFRDLCNAFLK